MRALVWLSFVVAPVASSQTWPGPMPLSPSETTALLDRLRPELLPDSVAASLLECQKQGTPITRGAIARQLLIAQTGSENAWTFYTPDGNAPLGALEPAVQPTSWIDTLATAGLVDARDRDVLRSFLDTAQRGVHGTVEAHPGVLGHVAYVLDLRDQVRRPQLDRLARRWLNAGLLTADAYERLLTDAGELALIGGAVPYLSGGIAIGEPLDSTSAEAKPPSESVVRAGVEAVSSRLDAPLDVGAVSVDHAEIVDDAGTDHEWRWARETVTVQLDGRAYAAETYGVFPAEAVADLLNRALRDRGDSVRVGLAVEIRMLPEPRAQTYLLTVTRRQLEALLSGSEPEERGGPDSCAELADSSIPMGDGPIRWASTPPVFAVSPTTDEAVAYVETLRRIGLLVTGTPEGIADAFLSTYSVRDSPDWVSQLLTQPGFRLVPFDEWASTVPPEYAEVTLELAALTRGAWVPADLRAEAGSDSLRYGFEVGGQRYEARLVLDGDWFDTEFLTLIARSVEDTVADGRFYWLGDAVLFLTSEQVRQLEGVPGFERLEPMATDVEWTDEGE